eukprot:TRINITY_DN52329_c0_g1_i1.p1 TRINITY_DN52329_c0_g1~~TRINITY_DN52329_c0_g1_i1.p1  ORF type:complete len:276 (+),score=68.65 TRINITY_DN52329_c0_g1_i1:47-829(+)
MASSNSLSAADQREQCQTYTQFLQLSGTTPDWVVERERRWREITAQKTSDRSSAVLARAVREGRRDDSVDLVNRMFEDYEARQERARLREAERLESEQNSASRGLSKASLTSDEASGKITNFFNRLQQDMANREAAQRKAARKVAREVKMLMSLSFGGSRSSLPAQGSGQAFRPRKPRAKRKKPVAAVQAASENENGGRCSTIIVDDVISPASVTVSPTASVAPTTTTAADRVSPDLLDDTFGLDDEWCPTGSDTVSLIE